MQRGEFRGLDLPQIAAEESGRAAKERDAVALDELRVFADLQRVRIRDGAHAFDERIPQRDGAAEAVKKRQAREHRVLGAEVQHEGKLRDVAEQIAMAEHHTLRLTAAAAGEEDHGFVAVADARQTKHQSERPGGQERDDDAPRDDLRLQRGQFGVEVQEVQRPRKIGQAFHHGMRGDAFADFADAQRGFHGRSARGEVEIHRHFVCERHGEVRDHRGLAGGKHDANAPAAALVFHMPREGDRRREQRTAG